MQNGSLHFNAPGLIIHKPAHDLLNVDAGNDELKYNTKVSEYPVSTFVFWFDNETDKKCRQCEGIINTGYVP